MKRFVALFLFSTIQFTSFSQSGFKHELGINTAAIFQEMPAVAGIYRCEKGAYAFRLLAGANWDHGFESVADKTQTFSTANTNTHIHSYYTQTGGRIALGIQKKFFIQDKWHLYKGIDAGYEVRYNQKEITTKLPNGFGNIREEKIIDNYYNHFCLSPVIGVRLHMLPRLSVSVEATVPICRYISTYKENTDTYLTDNLGVERKTATSTNNANSEGWKIDLSNQACRLFLSFHF